MLEAAYLEACKERTTATYRAKLEIIGHTGVGKTSLSHRLLGQPLPEEVKSTEGVATHWVNSRFNKDLLRTEAWTEALHDPDDVMTKFCLEVLTEHEKLSKTLDIMQPQRSEECDTTNTTHKFFQNDDKAAASKKEIGKMTAKTRDQLHQHHQKRDSENLSESTVDYSIGMWDYGGHTEFLATHQLFLNIDSIKLLLLDLSKPLTEVVNKDLRADANVGIPKTSIQFLIYWLDAIHGKAIKQKYYQPKIVLVLTHRDLIKATNVDQYIQDYINEILISMKDKPYSRYITQENIFTIDNKHDGKSDFVQLQNKLFKMIKTQMSWGIKRPVRWLKLEADILEKAKEASVNYLYISEVEQLAKLYGMDGLDLSSFLNFHHSLGDFLYYSGTDWDSVVITNPQWLADMFKTLITPNKFIEERKLSDIICAQLKQGIVTTESLEIL